ncbi:hypothetical protein SIFV0018 [Sulfolobus islandicus filamentous virus]|uniref:Uncharacterized protein 18 n=1 Tax=Sulfolobus islandicus filamentous virus (isolate Iceland/Hveragerdi) TaxID=654908 RepID=Y018_SIFVH|nr:hypothetical protein SIFV0018 [Sulfolobus islandicus filamentous virus]Q914L2.1 RecName: Full=Uncharacterized protein 18 [Sulfolobus islandicus filamentous virus (isolate Hveragerdi)]AAL27729.1 hypothetical protein [Sulfolobus islandicus filamentous virus]
MVEVKQKTIKYKLIIDTRDDSITLEGTIEAIITVKESEIKYRDKQEKFMGNMQTITENEIQNEVTDVKGDIDETLNKRFERYVNVLKTLEKIAEMIGAEIEVN